MAPGFWALPLLRDLSGLKIEKRAGVAHDFAVLPTLMTVAAMALHTQAVRCTFSVGPGVKTKIPVLCSWRSYTKALRRQERCVVYG